MPKNKPFLATLDCETDPFLYGRVPKPFIWGLYIPEKAEYREFTCEKTLIDFLRHENLIVYAHNGGKFDFHFLLDYIEPETRLMIINGRLSKFKIGECEFRDSLNILPVALNQYKKDDFDYTKLEKECRRSHMGEIKAYLKNDCVFLAEIVERFIKDYGNHITLASGAFTYWAENFYKKPKPKSGGNHFENYKKFYFGGRVECFKKGIIKKDFSVYDINSAYPRAMLDDHPWGYDISLSSTLPPEKDIGRCMIELTCISKGAFPLRAKNGGLSFPTDNVRRSYNVTGWEYLAGLKTKTIFDVEIDSVHIFKEKINFKGYVNHFYALKAGTDKKKDPAGYLLAKLFLNSLYGKFSINPNRFCDYKTIEPQYIQDTIDNTRYEFAGELGNNALMARPISEAHKHFVNVATGASITGFVRAQLWEAICATKEPFYCDTDCIAGIGINVPVSKDIGDWEKEGDFDLAGIAGKKLYVFMQQKNPNCYKIASKGVRLNKKEILAIAKGEIIEYKKDAPTFSLKKEVSFLTRKIKLT